MKCLEVDSQGCCGAKCTKTEDARCCLNCAIMTSCPIRCDEFDEEVEDEM